MFKKILSISIATAISSAAIAEGYQTEITGDLSKTENDVTETSSLAAGVKYHFEKVDTDGLPYYEAAFLNRSSNVWANHSFSTSETGELEVDSNTTTAGAEFYVPDTMLYVAGSASRYDADGEEDADNTWSVTAGVTPIDGLLVTTTYNEDEDYEVNFNAKYVTELTEGQFIAARTHFKNQEEDDDYGIGADYYFTKASSVGVEYKKLEGEKSTTLSARHFFTSDVFAGVSYTNGENSTDTYALNAGFRF